MDKGDNLTSFGNSRKSTQFNYYINVDEELDVFEQALDGERMGILQDFRIKMILKNQRQ